MTVLWRNAGLRIDWHRGKTQRRTWGPAVLALTRRAAGKMVK